MIVNLCVVKLMNTIYENQVKIKKPALGRF